MPFATFFGVNISTVAADKLPSCCHLNLYQLLTVTGGLSHSHKVELGLKSWAGGRGSHRC